VSDETPAVRLPRDYIRELGFVQINMLQHLKQFDREWDPDSTLGDQRFLCIVNHGIVVIQRSGAGGAGGQGMRITIISFSL